MIEYVWATQTRQVVGAIMFGGRINNDARMTVLSHEEWYSWHSGSKVLSLYSSGLLYEGFSKNLDHHRLWKNITSKVFMSSTCVRYSLGFHLLHSCWQFDLSTLSIVSWRYVTSKILKQQKIVGSSNSHFQNARFNSKRFKGFKW